MTLGVRKQCLALKVVGDARCSNRAIFDKKMKTHRLICSSHKRPKFTDQLNLYKVTHDTSAKDLESAYQKIRESKNNSPVETEMSTKEFLGILRSAAPAFLLIATFYHFFLYIGYFNYFELANFSDFSTDIFNPWLLSSFAILLGIIFYHDRTTKSKKIANNSKIKKTEKKQTDSSERKRHKIFKKINILKNNNFAPAIIANLNKLPTASKVFLGAILITIYMLVFNRIAMKQGNPKIIRFTDQSQIGGEFNLIKIMDKYTIAEKNGLIHVFPNGMVKSISYQSKTESSSAFSTFIILDESLPTNEGITNSKENHFQTTIELESKSVFQGSSFLLLPFFTNEVSLASQTGFTDEVPEFTQLKNLVFKLGKNKNFSTITITTKNASGKSVDTEYLSQLKKSLFICAANAKKEKIDFEIDVLGFASSDPFEGIYRSLPDDKNKSLNHILAESRRAAIIEKLGFNETGAIENSEGASIFLIKGPLQETSDFYRELSDFPEIEKHIKHFGFKYKNYDEMQRDLQGKVKVGTPANKESPPVEQAFARSAAIVVPEDNMKFCTH